MAKSGGMKPFSSLPLESRIDIASEIFSVLSRELRLPDIFRYWDDWAIIGGAVRDCLLHPEPDRIRREALISWFPGRDIDVAVANIDFEPASLANHLDRLGISYWTNSFGGIKAVTPNGGSMDLWKTHLSQCVNPPWKAWLEHLSNVDFGVNAVAYVWQCKRVLVHPTWLDWINKRVVEIVGNESPYSNLQPIRAIALAEYLTHAMKKKVHIGENARTRLLWLVTGADKRSVDDALAYLAGKIHSGKWSYKVLRRLLRECRRIPSSEQFRYLAKRLVPVDSKNLSESHKDNQHPRQQELF